MKKYIVSGKVTAFISVELEAENKKEAIEKAYEECSGPMGFVGNGGYDKLIGVCDTDNADNVGRGGCKGKMKEKKLYTCEFCHTDYAEKFACKQCEQNHKTNLAIKGMRFKPITVDQSGFPISITVVTDKGLEKVYHC